MKQLLTLLCLLLCLAASGQGIVLNSYGQVTTQSGNTLTVANISTSASAPFMAGGQAILMQTQDDVIGSNTTNTSSFGNLAAVQSAGLFEVVTISSISGSTFTLAAAPSNIYHYSANTSVQLISYPTLGSPNYTTTDSLLARSWDNSAKTGGVLAFRVVGTLTLRHNLSVRGKGFGGGSASRVAPADSACNATRYVRSSTQGNYYQGYKGQGIYNPGGLYDQSRGHLLSGGGGGGFDNAGGGGGGNQTQGGTGGPGYNGFNAGCSPGAGGVGGLALTGYITSSRLFLGGGGGGGQQNSNYNTGGHGTSGMAGGGILLLRVGTLATVAGVPVKINAQGLSGPNTQGTNNQGIDGAGGGGAGGSVLFHVDTYAVSSAGPINVNASGGKGGSVQATDTHGGGGGGGRGVFVEAGATAPATVTPTIAEGQGGANNNNPNVAPSYADPGGTAPTSTYTAANSPLPVVLVSLVARRTATGAGLLTWTTAQELRNDHFGVERLAADGRTWTHLSDVAAGGGVRGHTYSYLDAAAPAGVAYYRLHQVDVDGLAAYSPVVVLSGNAAGSDALQAVATPNPFGESISLLVTDPARVTAALVFDVQGRLVRRVELGGETQLILRTTDWPTGLYLIRWITTDNSALPTSKLVKQ